MRFLRIDGPVFRFLETITNLLILNLLFLVCSIPIVTIGPSLTATYYVALKMIRKEESGIIKDFFRSFRMNLKQGLILGISVLLLAAVLVVDIQALTYLTSIPENVSKILVYVVGLFLLILAMIAVYLFAVLAQFENKLSELAKWSMILVVRHFPVTLISLAIFAAPFLVMHFYPAFFFQTIMPILLLIGFAGMIYIQSCFLVRVFTYYIPTENTERIDENEE